jgi:flagellin-like protein
MFVEMDPTQDLFDDNSAVSPVIGVILMVAVAVIIAAAIGSTALGLGDSVSESPPQAQFAIEQETLEIKDKGDDFEGTPDDDSWEYKAVTVTLQGGDDIDKQDISVEVNGEPAYATPRPPSNFDTGYEDGRNVPVNPWDTVDGDTISSGDSTTIVLGTNLLKENDLKPVDDNIVFGSDDDGHILQANGGGFEINDGDGSRLAEGDEIRIVWESGDQSQTLLEEEVD